MNDLLDQADQILEVEAASLLEALDLNHLLTNVKWCKTGRLADTGRASPRRPLGSRHPHNSIPR